MPDRLRCSGRRMRKECEAGFVSVMTSTCNSAALVTEAMDSVWAQTYRPIELAVVDDGATGNTPPVVARRDKCEET